MQRVEVSGAVWHIYIYMSLGGKGLTAVLNIVTKNLIKYTKLKYMNRDRHEIRIAAVATQPAVRRSGLSQDLNHPRCKQIQNHSN
jgi:predicted GNAT family N-acyltransferase